MSDDSTELTLEFQDSARPQDTCTFAAQDIFAYFPNQHQTYAELVVYDHEQKMLISREIALTEKAKQILRDNNILQINKKQKAQAPKPLDITYEEAQELLNFWKNGSPKESEVESSKPGDQDKEFNIII